MIDAIFRPLAAPAYKYRKAAVFRSKWADTLDLLEQELRKLGAKNIVIQAGFRLDQIRNDGWPRSGYKPSHPGVVLSFNDPHGAPLSFPCDTYNDHEDNLRAIALSLLALRAVNRYGVTKGNEQYRGFAQLPAPAPNKNKREQAIAFLSRITGMNQDQVTRDPQRAYRIAAGIVHPDQGGSHEQFVELQGHWTAL